VTVLPDGPVAADDAAKCGFESQISIDVLGNDVAGVGGLVTLTIVAQPSAAGGTAVVTESNNKIEFTAAAGFSGIVTLTYEICDASNPTVLCDTALVQIDVDGTGPLAVNDAVTCEQNTASNVVVDVLDNDVQGTEALNTSSVTIVRQPEHGTITGVNAATGEVSFVPTPSYHGSDVFSYQVCDVSVPPKCASANVSVSVTPRGPTAVDDSVNTLYASAVTVAVLANDIAGAEPLQASSVTIVSGPSSNGATVTINPADGSI
jgi:large repetitive protein